MALPAGFTEEKGPPAGFTEDKGTSWQQNVSDYAVHPLIEGGGMAIGGAAGGAVAGPVGAAMGGVAMYPPAHQAANEVDKMLGLQPKATTLPQDLKSGLTMEAAGQAIPAVMGGVSKAVSKIPFAKFSEGSSGSPARNFSRMFKSGLPAYMASGVEKAGDQFGREEARVVGQNLTPEMQADMTVNPSGVAASKLRDVMVRWLKGEEISAGDALAAKQASQSLRPAGTAKNAKRLGKLSQFDDEMNSILAEKDPAMKAANDQYAAAKLKSQMLQPFHVNKTNPNEPSKLGYMLNAPIVGLLAKHGDFGLAAMELAAQSPAFLGFVSALSGTLSRVLTNLSSGQQKALARGLYSSFQAQHGGQTPK